MISVVLPCRNEEKAVGVCINKLKEVFRDSNIDGEIIVSDSSTDKSAEIAEQLGARVIKHNKVGYGNALLEGFKNAKGDIIVMGDCDESYDFMELPILLDALKDSDMVIGTREYIQKDAMPFLHRFVGNPLLSLTLRILFKGKVKDAHSGFRVIKKDKLEKLNLRTIGMEFASEMIIKATKNRLKIKEVPIHYGKRKGSSKLKSFSDGWKHLRFMLLYSPFFLFFIPGIFLFFLGLISMFWMYFGSPEIFGIKLFYHPMFLSSVFVIIGYQLIIFSLFAKTYAINHLGEKPIFDKLYKFVTIEKASILGILMILLGLIIFSVILSKWLRTNFGALQEIKNSIIALTLVILGIQTIFSSFMLSILGIKEI